MDPSFIRGAGIDEAFGRCGNNGQFERTCCLLQKPRSLFKYVAQQSKLEHDQRFALETIRRAVFNLIVRATT
ncbi:MAG: hypothetical protein ABIT76_04985 [Chthoniobacterales bacterium]